MSNLHPWYLHHPLHQESFRASVFYDIYHGNNIQILNNLFMRTSERIMNDEHSDDAIAYLNSFMLPMHKASRYLARHRYVWIITGDGNLPQK